MLCFHTKFFTFKLGCGKEAMWALRQLKRVNISVKLMPTTDYSSILLACCTFLVLSRLVSCALTELHVLGPRKFLVLSGTIILQSGLPSLWIDYSFLLQSQLFELRALLLYAKVLPTIELRLIVVHNCVFLTIIYVTYQMIISQTINRLIRPSRGLCELSALWLDLFSL